MSVKSKERTRERVKEKVAVPMLPKTNIDPDDDDGDDRFNLDDLDNRVIQPKDLVNVAASVARNKSLQQQNKRHQAALKRLIQQVNSEDWSSDQCEKIHKRTGQRCDKLRDPGYGKYCKEHFYYVRREDKKKREGCSDEPVKTKTTAKRSNNELTKTTAKRSKTHNHDPEIPKVPASVEEFLGIEEEDYDYEDEPESPESPNKNADDELLERFSKLGGSVSNVLIRAHDARKAQSTPSPASFNYPPTPNPPTPPTQASSGYSSPTREQLRLAAERRLNRTVGHVPEPTSSSIDDLIDQIYDKMDIEIVD